MDKKFFDFPLCFLQVLGGGSKDLEYVTSWCIVNHANKLEEGVFEQRVYDSAEYFGFTISDFDGIMSEYKLMCKHIENYEKRHGDDSYCRMGKDLTNEAQDGKFDFKQYRVLCAINSILGKKKRFARITYDRIRYAMYGYRSKSLYEKEKIKMDLLSDRQLKYIIDILHAKKFFSRFTYGRRQIFYSTRIDTDEFLIQEVKKSKIYWQEKKLRLRDKMATAEIKKELDYLKCEVRFYEQQQRKLRLIKAS